MEEEEEGREEEADLKVLPGARSEAGTEERSSCGKTKQNEKIS